MYIYKTASPRFIHHPSILPMLFPHPTLRVIRRINHTIIDIQAIRILLVARPHRKRDRLSTSAKHRKREHKHQHLGAAVHGGRDDVVVLYEQGGEAAADVALDEETDDEEGHAGGVYADWRMC